jgi:hypothetical protein
MFGITSLKILKSLMVTAISAIPPGMKYFGRIYYFNRYKHLLCLLFGLSHHEALTTQVKESMWGF